MEGLNKNEKQYLSDLQEQLYPRLLEEFEQSNITNENAHLKIEQAIYQALTKCPMLETYKKDLLNAMARTFYGGYCQWSELDKRGSLKVGVFPKLEKLAYNSTSRFKHFKFLKRFPGIKLRRNFDTHIFKLIQDSFGPGEDGMFDLFTTRDGKKSYGLFSKLRKKSRMSKTAFERLPDLQKLPENSQLMADHIFCRFGYALVNNVIEEFFESKGQTFEGLLKNPFFGIGKHSEKKIHLERYEERQKNKSGLERADQMSAESTNHLTDDEIFIDVDSTDRNSDSSSVSTNSRDSVRINFSKNDNPEATKEGAGEEGAGEVAEEINGELDEAARENNQLNIVNEELPDFSPIAAPFQPDIESSDYFEIDQEYMESFLRNYSAYFGDDGSRAIYETCVKGVISYSSGDYILQRMTKLESYSSVRSYVKVLSQSWANVHSTKEIEYCPCMLTLYYKENKDLDECECGKPRSEANVFTYESIRSYIFAICLTNLDQILEVKKDAWNNRNQPMMNCFNDGLLYLESLKDELDENGNRSDNEPEVIWLNFGVMGDSVNIKSKTYLGVFPILFHLFDLPTNLRHKNSYTYIPMVAKTIKETPGFLFAQTEVLFDDLTDLHINGMLVSVNGKDYLIKVRILGIVGDQPAINWMTETQGTKATYPCSLCDVNVVNNKIPALRGHKHDSIETRRRNFSTITKLRVDDLLNSGKFLNGWKRKGDTEESTGRKKKTTEKKDWGIKADFMISRVLGDYMRFLTNDLMHVFNENVFPKGIFGVLGDTRYAKMDPAAFNKIIEACNKTLATLKGLGVFEEYKGDNKLFTKRMAKEGTKAIDSKRFGTAFNIFFLSLFDTEGDSQFSVEKVEVGDKESTNQRDQNIDVNSRVSSNLSVDVSSSDEDPLFGSSSVKSIFRKVTKTMNSGVDDDHFSDDEYDIIAEAVDRHGQFSDSGDSEEILAPPPPHNEAAVEIPNEQPVEPANEGSVDNESVTNSKTAKRRGRIPNSEILTDSDSFKELTMLMIELNTLLNLLQSIDVPKVHVNTTEDKQSRVKLWYMDLIERIQLFSEKDKCEFVDEIFKLPLHSVGHLADKWGDFGSFYDFNCMEMERGGKFIKNLVKPNGDVIRILNKRVPSSCFLKFLEMYIQKRHLNLEQYRHPVTVIANVIRAKQPQISKFREKFNDQTRVKIKLPSTLFTRGTEIRLKKGLKYAKYRNDRGDWRFIEITEIVYFQSDTNQIYLLEYTELNVIKTWYRPKGSKYSICVHSKLERVSDESKEMWLDDSCTLFGVVVLIDQDNTLFDSRPSFHDLIKFDD
ncbi:hypothetical protein CANINC_004916 [Pichia inconspicua]|uniref:Uncharacterized protein n=1 Tax=Pichia inconspicua TaxID=52247 RepID=A0A4T0WW30_9ASCO|nr:hypothetical protein CANINC_004916 [[Candida] inconspicua]